MTMNWYVGHSLLTKDYVPVVILVVKNLLSCYAHSHNPGKLDLLVGEKKSRDKGHAGTLK